MTPLTCTLDAVSREPASPPLRAFEAFLDRVALACRRPLAVGGLVALSLLSLLTYRPPVDPDVFARVAVGRLVEREGWIVSQDPFAFTPRHDRWIDHEWLSGVVFYQVSQAAGELGLLALNIGMMLLTVGLLVGAARKYGGEPRVNTVWLILVMIPAAATWVSVVRSGVFTAFLLAWMLFLLVRWRAGERGWLWGLPLRTPTASSSGVSCGCRDHGTASHH